MKEFNFERVTAEAPRKINKSSHKVTEGDYGPLKSSPREQKKQQPYLNSKHKLEEVVSGIVGSTSSFKP